METTGSSETSEQHSALRKNATTQQLRRSKVRAHELKSWRLQRQEACDVYYLSSCFLWEPGYRSQYWRCHGLNDPGSESQQGRNFFLFQNVLFFGRWLGSSQAERGPRGAVGHSNSSCAEVKNEWSYIRRLLQAATVWRGTTGLFFFLTCSLYWKDIDL